MNLPHYFLADLPQEAVLTPMMITDACQALKRNRRLYLVTRPTEAIIDVLSEVAANWLRPDDPFRRMALEQGPAATGFSGATLERGLDGFFRRLTYDQLLLWVLQELGQAERLDRFVVTEPELKSQRTSIATGPELLVQVTAGNVPVPALASMVLGFLSRSAQFLKCSSRGALIPRLFAHSIYAIDPKLAASLELASWPGGQAAIEEALFAQADAVTATGSDEALASLRSRAPRRVRFVGHGHRVSWGYLTREALTRFHGKELAARAASDVAAWDQLGCLSPHLFYVEQGGSVTPELFAQMLAEQLARIEMAQPRGGLDAATAATIASRRSLYAVRAANLSDVRCWASEGSTAWTVVWEADPQFQLSCLHRFVYVKGVSGPEEALQAAARVEGMVSTIGLAAIGQRAQELAVQFARWGATRICPIGQMQDPPLLWRQDGRPGLADLVTWTDWEQ